MRVRMRMRMRGRGREKTRTKDGEMFKRRKIKEKSASIREIGGQIEDKSET